ncbi:uncharacterized protein EI90DRAFT_3128056 [Cantharellus anzutake]|uniref:uncharacterized protein n=1 Tax=Cantharellus anzutake TaxID=1750568 RepID=UPI001905528F|nr:uncharacterized protein EI90DRAFT_3128056 [Cantharellus anzutake]KAF8326194.1 hypothetical protein EI90DRAFT_3128056 [Cantharellus anzutake]
MPNPPLCMIIQNDSSLETAGKDVYHIATLRENLIQGEISVISIPGHRLPVPPIPPAYLHSSFTNLGAPIFRNPLGTPRWSPPPPFNLLPTPP